MNTATGTFRRERNVSIVLSDGIRLAADVRIPDVDTGVPAIVTYVPYHKDAMHAAYFDWSSDYFATRGYAVLVVDVRGLGMSEGDLGEAGDVRHGPDMADVIEWVAAQSWCDGAVGMWGISYGGITALRTAAMRPPALKAIVAIQGCLDIYDDAMYPGGAANCLGVVGVWGSMMLALQLMPPMWQGSASEWERVWTERLSAAHRPYMTSWHRHPLKDEYWQEKVTDGGKIDVPSFLIGSWPDIFPDAVMSTYEAISAPKKLWMGPWLHGAPDASPFDAIEYLPAMLRWWDRWLLHRDNHIDDEPNVSLFVRRAEQWRHEPAWPIERTTMRRLHLLPDSRLAEQAHATTEWIEYRGDPTLGTCAGLWEPLALGVGLPIDQGPDDRRSLTFTTEPLTEDWELTGRATASLRLRIRQGDDAIVVSKLVAVRPDGHSSLITTGLLRASHREGHDTLARIDSEQPITMEIAMWATSYQLRAGDRLRLSISCADFPRFWPTPTNPLIELAMGEGSSVVDVPLVVSGEPIEGPQMQPADATIDRFPLTISADPIWTIEHDEAHGSVAVTTGLQSEFFTPDQEGRMRMSHTARASVARDRPDGARVVATTEIELRLPLGQHVLVRTSTDSTPTTVRCQGTVEVDGMPRFNHSWNGDDLS